MPRTASTLPVRYRHFAVISLTITAGLAMFANSGNRDTLDDHISEGAEQQKKEASEKRAFNFGDNRKGGGSFGEEAGSAVAGGTGYIGENDAIVGPHPVVSRTVVHTADEADALPDGTDNGLPPGMTPEEIRAWQARRKRQSLPAATSEEQSASDVAAVIAASKARSGTPGS